MSVDVAEAIVIERPIAEVAAFAGDPSNSPAWYRRVSSAEWRTDPPISLGSRITFHARFLRRDLVYTYEVSEYSAGRHVEMRTTEGPFPMTTVNSCRAVGDLVTHKTLRNHGEPSGFSRLATPLIRRAMRRAMRQELTDLKRLLERA